jgi:hypothetical protein
MTTKIRRHEVRYFLSSHFLSWFYKESCTVYVLFASFANQYLIFLTFVPSWFIKKL